MFAGTIYNKSTDYIRSCALTALLEFMIDLKEIMVANGLAVLMMWFLLACRHKNRENIHTEDRIFDTMVFINLFGALLETVSFLVDGNIIPCGIAINYLSNSLCFIGTVSIGFLWCLYVDIRIYRNYKRTMHKAKIIMLPWLIEIAAIVCNLFVEGLMFSISDSNVYQRGYGSIIGYVSLMVYFAYSMYLVDSSKRKGINLSFFPVMYFIVPCAMGVVIQLLCYGISTSWVIVSVTMLFVQMQAYAENLYTDELTGLYNRRYLNGTLAKRGNSSKALYGIMIDLNNFKQVNDTFGHSVGDRAICTMGDILFKSMPDEGTAIRYAGDEFIVLLTDVPEEYVSVTIDDIKNELKKFNALGVEPYTLSAAMGYAKFEAGDDAGAFLTHMDSKMYEDKRKYHSRKEECI